MRQPLWERIKWWWCGRVGHDVRYCHVSRSTSCKRCRRLVAGPLQQGDA